MSINDPGTMLSLHLTMGYEQDALEASKRGCRMLDVHGCVKETDEG